MELSTIIKCECNNKIYKNDKSLKLHQKTKHHLAWMKKKELRELKIVLTKKDNEIEYLKQQIECMNKLNSYLINKMSIDETNI